MPFSTSVCRPRIRTFLAAVGLFLGLLAPGGLAHAQQNLDPGSEAYFAANSLYNRGLYELAAQEYRSFLTRFPGHDRTTWARLGLALSLYELERYDEAQRLLAQLAQDPNAPQLEQIHNLWGRCLLIANRPADAEFAFLWSVKRGRERMFLELPGIAESYVESPQLAVNSIEDLEPLERGYAGLIEAVFQQGKWTEVVQYSRELNQLVPDGTYAARTRFQAALAMYETADYDNAVLHLETLLSDFPETEFTEFALFLMAECHRELGNYEEAARNHTMVAREIKGNFAANALFRLGFIRFLQNRYRDAIKDFSDLRAIYPNNEYSAEAGIFLGRSYLELDEYREADSIFSALINDPRVAGEAVLWRGKSLLRQKSFEEARLVLEPAPENFRANEVLEELYFELGNAYLGLEQFNRAATAFRRVSNEFPDSPLVADSLRLQAFALHRSGNYPESLERCEAYLGRFKSTSDALDVDFLRAENLFFMERMDEALAVYRGFVPWEGTTPYSQEARFRIVQIFARGDAWDSVLREAQPLLGGPLADPFFETLKYLVGIAHFNLGEWGRSSRYLDEFVNEHPENENVPAALAKLARCRENSGDRPGARVTIERILEQHPESEVVDLAMVDLGRYQYEANEFEAAKDTLTEMMERFPESEYTPNALYYLGWIAVKQSSPRDAVPYFSDLVRRFRESSLAPDALYQKSLLLLEAGDFQLAQEGFSQYLLRYDGLPATEPAQFYLGIAHARMQEYRVAEEILGSFNDAYPRSEFRARAFYELAWCSRRLNDLLNAKKRYRELLLLNAPASLEHRALIELAEVEFETENFDGAISNLDQLLSYELSDEIREKALYRRGWSLLGRNQKGLAADSFETLLSDYPGTDWAAVAAYQAGEVRLEQNDFRTALANFSIAADRATDPQLKKQALLRRGEAEALNERWTESEATFVSYLREFPASEWDRRAKMWLGWAYENQRKFEQAITTYRAVLVTGDQDALGARSQFQIGECLFAMQQYDEAIRELIKVDVRFGFPEWTARALFEIGQILDRKEQPSEANERYKEVIQRFPGTDEAVAAQEILHKRDIYNF